MYNTSGSRCWQESQVLQSLARSWSTIFPAKSLDRFRPLRTTRCTASIRWQPFRPKNVKRWIALSSLRWSPRVKLWRRPGGRLHQRQNKIVLQRSSRLGSAALARSPMRYIQRMIAGRVACLRSPSPLFLPISPPEMCQLPMVFVVPSARRSPPVRQELRPLAMLHEWSAAARPISPSVAVQKRRFIALALPGLPQQEHSPPHPMTSRKRPLAPLTATAMVLWWEKAPGLSWLSRWSMHWRVAPRRWQSWSATAPVQMRITWQRVRKTVTAHVVPWKWPFVRRESQ